MLDKLVALKEKGDAFTTSFSLNDGVFAQAKVAGDNDIVFLSLGAKVSCYLFIYIYIYIILIYQINISNK